MRIYNFQSFFVITLYVVVNLSIITFSFLNPELESFLANDFGDKIPENTEIENLEFFNLKNKKPYLFLKADQMKSINDEELYFDRPQGEYIFQAQKGPLKYEALKGIYWTKKEILSFKHQVKLSQDQSQYFADSFKYQLKEDFIEGVGNIKFLGIDQQSRDKLEISSRKMKGHPKKEDVQFLENVSGLIQRQKKFEGKTYFSSNLLDLKAKESQAHLEGDVQLRRENYVINSGMADIYLENFNKSLKYFVLNDDVKVVEKLQTPKGEITRKSFSERVEGFSRDEKLVLTGAPRVESEKDVIKGYRITIRENSDLVEVDDAMSDVEVKKNDKKSRRKN